MSAIVRNSYRYKRPPRKRAKAAAIEAPVIVCAKKPRRIGPGAIEFSRENPP